MGCYLILSHFFTVPVCKVTHHDRLRYIINSPDLLLVTSLLKYQGQWASIRTDVNTTWEVFMSFCVSTDAVPSSDTQENKSSVNQQCFAGHDTLLHLFSAHKSKIHNPKYSVAVQLFLFLVWIDSICHLKYGIVNKLRWYRLIIVSWMMWLLTNSAVSSKFLKWISLTQLRVILFNFTLRFHNLCHYHRGALSAVLCELCSVEIWMIVAEWRMCSVGVRYIWFHLIHTYWAVFVHFYVCKPNLKETEANNLQLEQSPFSVSICQII